MSIPPSHPRYASLITREKLVKGVREGVASIQGLIAHGRGEAFDYLLGERTHSFAIEAERVAVASLLISKHPVISVNGNTASLVPEEVVMLAEETGAKIEVNIFHRSEERLKRIKDVLQSAGAKEVLIEGDAELKGLEHARRFVNSRGIFIADTVLVPLEDGDRCEVLKRTGKTVIAIDLNPMSRTALKADITIVNNIIRAFPEMIEFAKEMKNEDRINIKKTVKSYSNRRVLSEAFKTMKDNLEKLAEGKF